ncbi:enhancer of mRNA decapping [Orbilia brochopaga]|uniref:Enhancer of mRNA-decapping protein 3 n=1 Tax=Orbilia brochopaga TaxID=3140254 RepID=A0AAV9UZM9_9PEZI
MASQFVGYAIQVVVENGQILQGVVAALEGTTLVLSNAFDMHSGMSYQFYRIEGHRIIEIDVLNDVPEEVPPTASAPAMALPPPALPMHHPTSLPSGSQSAPQMAPRMPSQMSSQMSQMPPQMPQINKAPTPIQSSGPVVPPTMTASTPSPAPLPQKKPFVDPAIVSVGRPPGLPGPPQPTQNVPRGHPPGFAPRPGSGTTTPLPPPGFQPPQIRPSGPPTLTQNSPAVPLFQHKENKEAGPSVTRPPFTTPALTSPFSKLKLGDAVDSSAFEETDDPSQASFRQSRRNADHRARSGRRISDASSFGNRPQHGRYSNSNQRGRDHQVARRKHRHQNSTARDEDGWATEDINDIKDHEFDFQGNLDRFDKKTVFSQIEAEDTTAAEDRLVSFNKRPQNAGEAGVPSIRKNFKNSENVLGTYANGASLADRETWNDNSFLKKGAEMPSSSSDDEEEGGSGRSSRRGMARPNRHNATSKLLRKASVNVSGRISPNISSGIGSGGGKGEQLTNSSDAKTKPILRLKTSSRPCPVVSPLQMLDVERIAEVDLGLTDDMMTENAGRGIAQVAIQAFGRRLHGSNHNSLPVVLVFAGNNKSGARAVAAGRHLKNHHVRVLICVLGLEREEELLDHLRRQIQIFRNAGGRLAHWSELSYRLQSLDAPPELIIDGLLGMHVAFEDLRLSDQASLFELVKFANTSKAHIMSIDVPSGIDGHTGEVTTLDDAEQFYIKAKFVVCMGAPKTGVRAALQTVGAGWNLHVVDIGIPNTAWRKYGSRRRHGVEFGAEWVSAIEYIL